MTAGSAGGWTRTVLRLLYAAFPSVAAFRPAFAPALPAAPAPLPTALPTFFPTSAASSASIGLAGIAGRDACGAPHCRQAHGETRPARRLLDLLAAARRAAGPAAPKAGRRGRGCSGGAVRSGPCRASSQSCASHVDRSVELTDRLPRTEQIKAHRNECKGHRVQRNRTNEATNRTKKL